MIPLGTRRTYLSALPRRKGLELVLQCRAGLPGADAAALHQGGPVAPAQLLQSMGDPEGGDRCLLPVAELVNQADDLLLAGFIQERGGFIHQQELGIARQGSRDGVESSGFLSSFGLRISVVCCEGCSAFPWAPSKKPSREAGLFKKLPGRDSNLRPID